MRPPAKKRRAEGGGEVAQALAWLNSYPNVSRWMSKYDIEQLIDDGGGIAQVHNFLPPFVAEGALHILKGLPPGRWNDTAADEDYRHNNIAHRFWSVKAGPPADGSGAGGRGNEALGALLRAFSLLRPEQFNAFSAARYERDHHIAPHDDRAYTPVRLDTGEVVTCSRDLTCVYYLTKDWTEDMGGALVDLEATDGDSDAPGGHQGGTPAAAPSSQQQQQQQEQEEHLRHPQQQPGQRGRVYVPQFNSAVFFRVPRYHSVTPLKTDRPRYSVFGWYLQPGKLYDLFTGDEQQRQQQQKQQQAPAGNDPVAGKERRLAEAPRQQQQVAGKQRKAGKRRQQEEQQGGSDAPQCKLAQRLLAKLAAKQQRQQLLEG